MARNSDWRRVTRAERCPICEKPDWCLVTGPEGNPSAAICARIESGRRAGEAGWLHHLRDDERWQPRPRTIRVSDRPPADVQDFGVLATRCERALEPAALGQLAQSLGVSAHSLCRLAIGWLAEQGAFTFPMRDAAGAVRGIRLRLPSGRKLSVRGGREGLFVPRGLAADGLLLVSEGPTDTAALLDLGFAAIGRPSCTGGMTQIIELVRQWPAAGVVVVGDNDRAGQRGANNLAAVLVAYAKAVRVITPVGGAKDARDWKRRGATRDDVMAAIDAAPVRRLVVRRRKARCHA